jgi:hypothetical protein
VDVDETVESFRLNEAGAGGLDVLKDFEEVFEIIVGLDSSANSGLL